MKRITTLLLIFLPLTSFAQPKNKFALIIGVTGYPNYSKASDKLNYADDDAKMFFDFLTDPEGPAVPVPNIVYLINNKATRRNIMQGIEYISKRASMDDQVYIFFSGHNETDPRTNASYFMPFEADNDSPSLDGLKADDFVSQIQTSIDARSIVYFIDACHAASVYNQGSVKGGRDSKLISVFNEQWNNVNSADGRTSHLAILSAQANQSSFEHRDLRHGVFTWFLIKGLRGEADRTGRGDRNGIVDASEIYLYVLDSVEYYVKRKFNADQSPFKSPGFKGSYPLAITAKLDANELRTPPVVIKTQDPAKPSPYDYGIEILYSGAKTEAVERALVGLKRFTTNVWLTSNSRSYLNYVTYPPGRKDEARTLVNTIPELSNYSVVAGVQDSKVFRVYMNTVPESSPSEPGNDQSERTISGRVVYVDGSPLPGVNVMLKGTTTGTTTDADGKFTLTVPRSGGILVTSFIGLKTLEQQIADRSVVDFQMEEDSQSLLEESYNFKLGWQSGVQHSPYGFEVGLGFDWMRWYQNPISVLKFDWRGQDALVYGGELLTRYYVPLLTRSRIFSASIHQPGLGFRSYTFGKQAYDMRYIKTGLDLGIWRFHVSDVSVGQTLSQVPIDNSTRSIQSKDLSLAYKVYFSLRGFKPFFYHNLSPTQLYRAGMAVTVKRFELKSYYEHVTGYSGKDTNYDEFVGGVSYKF